MVVKKTKKYLVKHKRTKKINYNNKQKLVVKNKKHYLTKIKKNKLSKNKYNKWQKGGKKFSLTHPWTINPLYTLTTPGLQTYMPPLNNEPTYADLNKPYNHNPDKNLEPYVNTSKDPSFQLKKNWILNKKTGRWELKINKTIPIKPIIS